MHGAVFGPVAILILAIGICVLGYGVWGVVKEYMTPIIKAKQDKGANK
jgi:hypothetical protein